jgi:hypothetical protein
MQKHEPLATRIINALAAGPRAKLDLRNDVVGNIDTYQAFYKAFRKLKQQEVVAVHKNAVSLSIVWIQNEAKRIEQILTAYQLPAYRSYFGSLKDGQRLTFKFKTLAELELFWTHAILVAVEAAHENAVIISVLPHDWFAQLRPENTELWYRLLGKRNKHCAVITHADADEKRRNPDHEAKTIENMFGVNPLHQKESQYINIVDDLLFEATLDDTVLPGIRKAVRGEVVDVQKLVNQRGTFKLSIRRDENRSTHIRKKIQKYFSIPLFN